LTLTVLTLATTPGCLLVAWQPMPTKPGGILYAFREDAVREDEVMRPVQIETNVATPNPGDPALDATTKISTKAVDQLPDPDRRAHGFRLQRGKTLARKGSSLADTDNIFGLSFISDNPVYIQGDFNCHIGSPPTDDANGCSGIIEEFTQTINGDIDADFNETQFYTNRTSLNTNFAKPDTDWWRPSDILADAVTIISDNFCDGSIEDGFLTAGTPTTATVDATKYDKYGCLTPRAVTSYLNQNRATTLPTDGWARENPYDPTSPIKVNVSGRPFFCSNPVATDPNCLNTTGYNQASYMTFADQKQASRLDAKPTRVNAIIISGLVPSIANPSGGKRSYGGLHNFPRFIERWNQPSPLGTPTPLYISGSLVQLNFSNYATGPFSQIGWEAGAFPTGEQIKYYEPPNRRWGYDVGLQYAPASPVASRLTQVGNARSEYYEELSIDDRYICKLRNAAALTTDTQRTQDCP
ncbi:MAG: hypothetical protein HC925_01190, partial [Coleofasciculaceae cyanobacterium SM2_3_26]|nr:hypothetical protein [Coleofasciculaceae cyanobacterium SM2_3_26]